MELLGWELRVYSAGSAGTVPKGTMLSAIRPTADRGRSCNERRRNQEHRHLINDCIGRRDITGLSSLMTDDHVFIDTANNSISGKNCCLAAWKSFFAAFPNYRNIFHQVLIVGDHAVIVGHSVCADRRLVGPALWTAKLSGTLVAEWRVYEDTTANHAHLGVAE